MTDKPSPIAQAKITMWPVHRLKPAAYNPRLIAPAEMRNLKASVKQYGMVQPIVTRESDGLVIGGHQRLTALIELLTDEHWPKAEIDKTLVPVALVNLTDAQAKALNLALNKISGEWDYAKLTDILVELDTAGTPGLTTGFTDQEITDLLEVAQRELPKPGTDLPTLPRQLAQKRITVTLDADDHEFASSVLKKYGMTGPENISAAFMALIDAVADVPTPAAAAPKKGRK